ncbi:NADPH:quinone oxidoreductase family protein [Actinomadura sp. KC216]|uniref:NADPH:quinone oxidoreductase family protein n=1 Tax=Actinomadura sp. KC216 TaxID=2530370 RepID=UPI001046BD35|nr:NADPH:quinone oxidoreductase family protein [Actinomadura sp. KC216]TDB88725.1 NADPH:quinone oxidoreductase family protein [Actinomadura sp. KC216]
MRAVQVVGHAGPAASLVLAETPIPARAHPRAPDGDAILIDVQAAGVSFPEVLQTYGRYQFQPDLPFVPGSEVAGYVRSAPHGSPFKVGDRVAACTDIGAWAEVASAPASSTVRLSDRLNFTEGASLLLNYHTAYFAMVLRGRLRRGESMLVHGAAGGVGTAALQIAAGLGIETIAVVSTPEKAGVARQAGASQVVLADDDWKGAAQGRGGVHAVLDTVGGDRVLDSMRSLREGGRLIVVGFASGEIPEVRLNRVLLRNLDVIGVEWTYALTRPAVNQRITEGVDLLVEKGVIKPLVHRALPLKKAAEAATLLEERRALGKVVLEINAPHRP